MKVFLIITSFAILALGIKLLLDGLSERNAMQHGKVIRVVLHSVPRGRGIGEFVYGGKVHSRLLSGRGQNYRIGDTLVLRHVDGRKDFYFLHETGTFTLVLSALVMLLGISGVVGVLRDKRY